MLACRRGFAQGRPMRSAADVKETPTGPDFSPPDFTHVETWVFDLDHTLYTFNERSTPRWRSASAAMSSAISTCRATPPGRCRSITEGIWQHAGRLMVNQKIDPDAYHDDINDIEALDLKPDTALRAGLARLPGRRLVIHQQLRPLRPCGADAAGRRRPVRDHRGRQGDGLRAQAEAAPPMPPFWRRASSRPGAPPCSTIRPGISCRRGRWGMTTVWFNDGKGQSYWRIDNRSFTSTTRPIILPASCIRSGSDPMSQDLARIVDAAWENRDALNANTRGEVREAVETALGDLDAGRARVAEKHAGAWVVHQCSEGGAAVLPAERDEIDRRRGRARRRGGTRSIRNSPAGMPRASSTPASAPCRAPSCGAPPSSPGASF